MKKQIIIIMILIVGNIPFGFSQVSYEGTLHDFHAVTVPGSQTFSAQSAFAHESETAIAKLIHVADFKDFQMVPKMPQVVISTELAQKPFLIDGIASIRKPFTWNQAQQVIRFFLSQVTPVSNKSPLLMDGRNNLFFIEIEPGKPFVIALSYADDGADSFWFLNRFTPNDGEFPSGLKIFTAQR